MMTPLLFCNHSPVLPALWAKGAARVDGVEVTPFHRPAQIRELRQAYPDLPFQCHASNVGRAPGTFRRLEAYLRACPESRWVSLHLSPVPSWIVYAAMRWQINFPVPDPQKLIPRFIERIMYLKRRVNLPVILENMAVVSGLESSFEFDPGMITHILSRTACDLLLDLGHARVAADFRNQDIHDYLQRLPLARVSQIHISGPRRRDGQLYDAHQPLQDVDYRLLCWLLDQTDPEIVTLEYYRNDGPALRRMLDRLDKILSGEPC